MLLPRDAYRETVDVFQYYEQARQCYNRIRSNGGNAEIVEMRSTDRWGDRVITYRVDRFEDSDYNRYETVDSWDEVVNDDWKGCRFNKRTGLYENHREHQPRVVVEVHKPSNIRESKERKIFILD